MKIDVLFLDDDKPQLKYYRAVLEPLSGIGRVTCCINEQELDIALETHRPHIIISDIHMEPKEGPDILRERKEKLAGINIILLSCADSIAEETRILRADDIDVVSYLQKPFQPRDLYEILGHGIDS